jgi:hypothetical protein
MSTKERVEVTAAAIAASVLGAMAERRDTGGIQLRDFDLIFPGGHVEPLEVTRHFDQAATETWKLLGRAEREAPSLTRSWTLDVPNKRLSPSGRARPYGGGKFPSDVEPALRQLEEAGHERFDLGLGRRDPSVAPAIDVLARLGIQFGLSRELPSGAKGRISAVAAVGGVTDPNKVAQAIEIEAGDAGNQAKLREPPGPRRRHLFVPFDPSSGSAYNAVDRGMLGRIPDLPDPITTAWVFVRNRVFVTTPPEGWQEHPVPEEVMNDPERWVVR